MRARYVRVLLMCGVLVLSVLGIRLEPAGVPEPIATEIDLHFVPPALETVPSGSPHVGDTVKIVAHLGLEWGQMWTKRGVVIDTGGPTDPDRLTLGFGAVIHAEGEYKIWYQAANTSWPLARILYGNSSDGISWNKHGVVLSPGPPEETEGLFFPAVIMDGSLFKMWYSGYDGANYRIFYATSLDGMHWTRQGRVLDIGPPGSYDDLFVYRPAVILDGVYKMWYTGFDGYYPRILYATSPDGVSWTKHGLVMDHGPPGALDEFASYMNCVLKEGGGYHMWYTGHSPAKNNRVFYATSPDGVSWTKRGMVLDLGPPSGTDSVHVAAPSVLHISGSHYQMWYTGRQAGTLTDRIHYANLTAVPLPTNVEVEFYLDGLSPSNSLGKIVTQVGASSAVTASIDWTAGPAGNHTIHAVIDPLNKLPELSETNNTVSMPITVIGGIPPVADAGPDVNISEGQSATLNGNGSYDQDGYITNYSWDLDKIVDSDGDGDPGNDLDAWTPVVTSVYGDNGAYCAILTVTDDDGLKARDEACVHVSNVAPKAAVFSVWSDVNLTLRVAGRKWNQVGMELFENDALVANVTITRMPGSPDEQAASVRVSLNMMSAHRAIVRYYPNETRKGEIGSNPVWIILSTDDGKENRIHHTFNVQQSIRRNSSHWNHVEPWIVDINAGLAGLAMKVSLRVEDQGSDDLMLDWSTGDSRTFYNNGLSPDPAHSPEGIFPFVVAGVVELVYPGTGVLLLTVTDDDGGSTTVSVTLA